MKTLIKLIIAAAVINAVVRTGSVALDYYQFKDETQQIVLFGGETPLEQLRDQILKKAADHDVPLAAKDLTVRRDGTLTVADAMYVAKVEVFPKFIYPVTFSFSVDGRAFNTGAARSN